MDSNWKEDLNEAKKRLLACERLLYVGITILKDNRILARTIGELAKATLNTIKAYLKYESQMNKSIWTGSNNSILSFFKKIAPKYISLEDREVLAKILSIAKIHKVSSMEFVRNERLVMQFNGKYEVVAKENIMEYSKVVSRLIKAFPAEKA